MHHLWAEFKRFPRPNAFLEHAPPHPALPSGQANALLTDLDQLTMLQAYVLQDMHETAVFDLFARRLPAGRNYLVACGLQQALEYLTSLRFGR